MPPNKAAMVKRFARTQNGRRGWVPNLLFCVFGSICETVQLAESSTTLRRILAWLAIIRIKGQTLGVIYNDASGLRV